MKFYSVYPIKSQSVIALQHQYEILIAAEKSERTLFQGLAGLVEQLAQRKAPDAGSAP
jgi:hypothetical protein